MRASTCPTWAPGSASRRPRGCRTRAATRCRRWAAASRSTARWPTATRTARRCVNPPSRRRATRGRRRPSSGSAACSPPAAGSIALARRRRRSGRRRHRLRIAAEQFERATAPSPAPSSRRWKPTRQGRLHRRGARRGRRRRTGAPPAAGAPIGAWAASRTGSTPTASAPISCCSPPPPCRRLRPPARPISRSPAWPTSPPARRSRSIRGANLETAVIATVGTAGATTAGAATERGRHRRSLSRARSASPPARRSPSTAARTRRRRSSPPPPAAEAAPRITVTAPLTLAHAAGAQVSGSGITLTAALTRAHAPGTAVASDPPTPGAPNRYSNRPVPTSPPAKPGTAQASGDRWWPGYGNGPDNSRYFASRQINKSNVNQLQVAWTYPFGDTGSSPIVVRGVDLRPRPQRIARRRRREDRQGAVGPREHERHDQPRHQLLGKRATAATSG